MQHHEQPQLYDQDLPDATDVMPDVSGAYTAPDSDFLTESGIRIQIHESDDFAGADTSHLPDLRETLDAIIDSTPESNKKSGSMFVALIGAASVLSVANLEAVRDFEVPFGSFNSSGDAQYEMPDLPNYDYLLPNLGYTEVVAEQEVVDNAEQIKWLPETVAHWQPLIDQAVAASELPALYHELVPILITLESGGNPEAESGVGAQGLGQVMPSMREAIIANYGKNPNANMYNPEDNLDFMVTLLTEIAKRAERESPELSESELIRRVAAGYNGGIAMEREVGVAQAELSYRETNVYSQYAQAMFDQRHMDSSEALRRWLTDGHGQNLVDDAEAWIQANK